MKTPVKPLETNGLTGQSGLKYANTGALVVSSLSCSKLYSCSWCHCHTVSSSISVLIDDATWERSGINFERCIVIPKKRRNLFVSW